MAQKHPVTCLASESRRLGFLLQHMVLDQGFQLAGYTAGVAKTVPVAAVSLTVAALAPAQLKGVSTVRVELEHVVQVLTQALAEGVPRVAGAEVK